MTKIAIVAATEAEIAPVRAALGEAYVYSVTGVGATATAVATLAVIDAYRPHLIVQIGIAGAVVRDLELLQAVVVERDYQADLGAWRGERFERFSTPVIEYPYVVEGFRSVRARSVMTACAPWIVDDSEIESMEGAAFMEAARSRGVRFMQMRVISNYVDQPRGEWQIFEAIASLPTSIAHLFQL